MSTREPVVEMMDPAMVEVMRNKRPAERLAIAFEMWESARVMIAANVRRVHPGWSQPRLRRKSPHVCVAEQTGESRRASPAKTPGARRLTRGTPAQSNSRSQSGSDSAAECPSPVICSMIQRSISASICAHNVPGPIPPNSTTLNPLSGPIDSSQKADL